MKARLLACLAVLMLPVLPAPSQIVVTFDDLPNSTTGTFIASPYQGLSWSNFGVVNGILQANAFVTNGYYYGMVSPSNVAYNGFGNPAEIDSATNFNFLSVYLTGAWNSNLNIEVEGFNGAQEIYNTIVVASATNPTLFTFDYFNIDRLYFDSYGGEPAFGGTSRTAFAMDNFMFEFIPEPSSLLLALMGCTPLVMFLRRRWG